MILQVVNAKLASQGLMLKSGTVMDATLIAAPSSTKNKSGERDPAMHYVKKGNQWHFGMNAHIGVDADSGLVHTVICTAANVNKVTQGHCLLHGEESVLFVDAGFQVLPSALKTLVWIGKLPCDRANAKLSGTRRGL